MLSRSVRRYRFSFQTARPKTQLRDLAAQSTRVLPRTSCPSKFRGRRESRVANAPAASRAKLNKAHERRHHRFTGVDPAFPAQWFYGLYRALPGERILVVTVTDGLKARQTRSDLISPPPAWHQQRVSEPHGFAVRSSADHLARWLTAHEVHLALRLPCAPDALASTASRPAFVTTRDRPSVGRDGEI